MNIVKQEYWDDHYKDTVYKTPENEVTEYLDKWIEEYLKIEPIRDCFEIGCYPGGFLAHISRKYGFRANGVDLTNAIENHFTEWLTEVGVKVGDFYCEDAFQCIDDLKKKRKEYDFVYSLGFIEHFDEYLDVIKKHGEILRSGGLLIITTPNFAGFFQRIAHLLVDKKNYNRHVIKSMNPDEWKNTMEKEGFETLFSGYFGIFDFWVENQNRNTVQKVLLKGIIRLINPLKKLIKKDGRCFSPYCGIVLVKR